MDSHSFTPLSHSLKYLRDWLSLEAQSRQSGGHRYPHGMDLWIVRISLRSDMAGLKKTTSVSVLSHGAFQPRGPSIRLASLSYHPITRALMSLP